LLLVAVVEAAWVAGVTVQLGLLLLPLLLLPAAGVRFIELLVVEAAAAVGGTPIAVAAVVLVVLVYMPVHRLVAHGGLTQTLLLVQVVLAVMVILGLLLAALVAALVAVTTLMQVASNTERKELAMLLTVVKVFVGKIMVTAKTGQFLLQPTLIMDRVMVRGRTCIHSTILILIPVGVKVPLGLTVHRKEQGKMA
tara:strand:+ start:177 stop:761 length:585 start_codon:yes stop_codon:yes gene_type:complete